MSVTTTEELPAGSAIADDDPFGLDITFIENTLPASSRCCAPLTTRAAAPAPAPAPPPSPARLALQTRAFLPGTGGQAVTRKRSTLYRCAYPAGAAGVVGPAGAWPPAVAGARRHGRALAVVARPGMG